MYRYLLMFIFVTATTISIACNTAALQSNNSKDKKQIVTQEQAAELAAKLANERFQKDFHSSQFTPESYPAELVGSTWHWGKIDPKGINGCAAKVEFKKDGSGEDVKVAFFTDRAYILDTIKTDPSKDGVGIQVLIKDLDSGDDIEKQGRISIRGISDKNP